MRVPKKVKKEYSSKDSKFPIKGKVAKALIEASGLTIKETAEQGGISGATLSNWMSEKNLAPRATVLKVFGPLGITENSLEILVDKQPSQQTIEKLEAGRKRKRECKLELKERQNNVQIEEFADHLINLSQAINQVEQNQKDQSYNWQTLFAMLNKMSEDQAKQQNYLVNEINSLKKEVREKNALIRELQR